MSAATNDPAEWFRSLQDSLVSAVSQTDPQAALTSDDWQRPAEGGGGRSRVFSNGDLIEKGGINFSHVFGKSLPASATERRPDLADRPFEAMGVSVVFHPRNPFVPATHMNVRFFRTAQKEQQPVVWWFGGGFDLTPVFPFQEDAVQWHRAAAMACRPFGPHLYPRFKEACDRYFFLPHRNETRGIGGLFFDDFTEPDFSGAFALTRSVGHAFWPAYQAIARKRRSVDFTQQDRDFQLYRRGRYAEFNLLYDRGTRFGLQSGGRTESILMSMPPLAAWHYNPPVEAGSVDETLHRDFLQPRDWLAPIDSPSAP